MRLSASEIEGIKKSINQFIFHDYYTLFLFGSRANQYKKGGDIDLLLVLAGENAPTKNTVMTQKHHIIAEIKSAIGDQKIDLVIAEKPDLTTDPFLQEITKTAIEL